jgi:starch phosphorylase
MRELNKIIKNDLGDSVVFIPNYDIEIAKLLTSGCDVWLNTPIIGTEACGTSGMKACLNGILPLTTSDGWFDEVDLSNIGWKVEDNDISKNLLDALENEIIPEYYNDRNKWTERMNNARNLILKNFSTERMLDEYVEKLYTPTYLLNKKI